MKYNISDADREQRKERMKSIRSNCPKKQEKRFLNVRQFKKETEKFKVTNDSIKYLDNFISRVVSSLVDNMELSGITQIKENEIKCALKFQLEQL